MISSEISSETSINYYEMIALMIDEVMFYGNSGGFHGILTFFNIKTELKCKLKQLKDSSLIYFYGFLATTPS